MNDERKTKAQLIAELAEVRQRVIELEAAEAERARVPEKAPGVFEDAALRDSETRYRRLFETAQDGILLLDAATGQITDVNPFLEKLLGYSHAELIGQYLWEIGPFRDVADSKLAFEQLQTNEYIRYEDLPLETRDGRRVNVEFVSNVYLVNGVKVIQCNVRDITARKRTEEALAQNQYQFRTLMDNIPDHIYFKDTQSRFIRMNKSMADWFGLADSAQALGKTDFDFFTQEHAQSAYADEQEVIRTGQPLIDLEEKETWPGRPDSWASTTKMPLHNSVGKIVGTFGVSRDITERKRAEEALRESEARLRQMTSSMREALWLRDARTLEVLYVNPAYEELWGRTCESLYQDPRSFLEAVLPEDKERVMQAIQKQYQGLFFNQEYRIIRPDGSVRWIWGRTFPIRDEAGQLVRVTAIAEDITERKQAEEALRELNATLEQRVADRTRRLYEANAHLAELDQLKDQFISRISHELRTPLTNIMNYLDLLEHGKSEKHAQYLQVLHEQAAQLRGLIESLLEVTQKSVNAAGVHVAPTDLNQLVTALLTEIAPRAAQRGLTLTSALTPELPFVSADGRLLAQALSKLATNALNYTPAGGTIDLATAEVIDAGATWITFTIRDSGPGIALDEQAHIFDRFYRGRAAADYKTPGAGVGLSISRDILTSLDGRLTVDSQPGEGATFTAWLKPA